MKRTMKLMSLFLALALLLSVFSACGTPAETNDNSSKSTPESDPVSVNESSSGEEPIEITWTMPETLKNPLSIDQIIPIEFQKRMNIKLNLQTIPESDYGTKISTMLATDTLTDIVELESDQIGQAASAGLLLNASQYSESMPNYLELANAEDRYADLALTRLDGDYYAFKKLNYYRTPYAIVPMMRMDLIEETGLPTPTSFEELYEVMLKIKENHPENYVFSTRKGTTYLLGNIAYAMGAGGYGGMSEISFYYEPEQEKWLYGPTNPNFENAVQYLADAYRDGLLHPDYAVMDPDTLTAYLENGKLALAIDNRNRRSYNCKELVEAVPGARFDAIIGMTYGDRPARQITFERDESLYACISAKTEHPEKLVSIMDYFYSDEGRKLFNFGVEGVTYETDGDTIKLTDETKSYLDETGNYDWGKYGVNFYLNLYVDDTMKELGYNYTLEAKAADEEGVAKVNIGPAIEKGFADGVLTYNKPIPNLTSEELGEVVNLMTALDNVFVQEIDKFITGARPMSEWNDLVEQLKSLGSEEMENILNTAYQRDLQ